MGVSRNRTKKYGASTLYRNCPPEKTREKHEQKRVQAHEIYTERNA